MKQGRSLEMLVHALERQLAGDHGLKIQSPKRLRDRRNNRLREHDVVITSSQSHHTLMIAIECKDRGRPVGVTEIEAFESKCRHTGVNQGVIVSSSGFYESAKEIAEKIGIKCIELRDIENASFLAPGASVVVHTNKVLTVACGPIVKEALEGALDDYQIYARDGRPITEESIKRNVEAIADSLPFEDIDKQVTAKWRFRADGFYLIRTGDNKKEEISGILLTITYVHEVGEAPFRSRSYMTAAGATDPPLAEVATAKIEMDGRLREVALIGSTKGVSWLNRPGYRGGPLV